MGSTGKTWKRGKAWSALTEVERAARKEKIRLQQLASSRRLSDERSQIGLCRQCREPIVTEFSSLCAKHFYARTATNRLGAANCVANGRLLGELFERQNHTCAYSGAPLVLGKNATVDHILPESRYPELAKSIANLQWVDRRINTMKTTMRPDEFIAMCRLIVRRADGCTAVWFEGSDMHLLRKRAMGTSESA